MARLIERLSPAKVRTANAGMHADGNNLYLQVTTGGAKSWLFRYMLNGKPREMGLGSNRTIGLAEARARAAEARKMLLDGCDPIDHRRKSRREAMLLASRATSFEKAASAYIADRKASWSNDKHAKQWSATLQTYVYPFLGKDPVAEIDLNQITKVLKPIWEEKPETASRVRQRVEAVLDYATTKGWRSGDNPARWGGNLENVFPKKSKISAVNHHKALPVAQLPSFVTALGEQDGLGARALLLTILTACRTGEVICARWEEFDLGQKTWLIPAARMKGRKEHRIPLSDSAVGLLNEINPRTEDDDPASGFVFPGQKKNSGLSNMALLKVLERMGRTDVTTHGFRSTFRVWAAEQTDFPTEIVEAALAHVVSNKVIAAYRRTDYFDRRRKLMDEWANFCMLSVESNEDSTRDVPETEFA